jgi:hypothetical protein
MPHMHMLYNAQTQMLSSSAQFLTLSRKEPSTNIGNNFNRNDAAGYDGTTKVKARADPHQWCG